MITNFSFSGDLREITFTIFSISNLGDICYDLEKVLALFYKWFAYIYLSVWWTIAVICNHLFNHWLLTMIVLCNNIKRRNENKTSRGTYTDYLQQWCWEIKKESYIFTFFETSLYYATIIAACINSFIYYTLSLNLQKLCNRLQTYQILCSTAIYIYIYTLFPILSFATSFWEIFYLMYSHCFFLQLFSNYLSIINQY